MGAHSVISHHISTTDLKESWNEFFAKARSEHGNDPYSGSFATCSGVVAISSPMSLGEARDVADAFFLEQDIPERSRHLINPSYATASGRILRHPRKWDAAFAIPVFDLAGEKIQEKSTVISHQTEGVLHREKLRRLIESKIVLPPHGWVDYCEVLEDKVRTQKTVSRPEGKRQTTWFLTDTQGRHIAPRTEYGTEREAIAAATEYARKQVESGLNVPIEVRGLTSRSGGFSTVALSVISRRTKVSYKLHTPTDHTRGGWLFFALAAS